MALPPLNAAVHTLGRCLAGLSVFAVVAGSVEGASVAARVLAGGLGAQGHPALLAFMAWSVGVAAVHHLPLGLGLGLVWILVTPRRLHRWALAIALAAAAVWTLGTAAGVELFDGGGKLSLARAHDHLLVPLAGVLTAALLGLWAQARTRLAPAALLAVVLLGSLGTALAPDPLRAARAETQQPNVVLVVADTLRADHLGTHGYPRDTSPVLDALAAQGVVYENARVQFSQSTPSHASILTGDYPYTHTATTNGSTLPAGATLLSEQFAAAGYHTAAIHDHGLLSVENGFAQGFYSMVETKNPDLRGSRPAVWRRELRLARFWDVLFREERHTVTDLTVDWLQGPLPEPFFLWVVQLQPHTSYHPPSADLARFADPAYDGPMDGSLAAVPMDPAQALGPDDRQHMVDRYDAEVRWTDRSIGRILAALDDAGVRERTLVAITADHGEALGEHGVYYHHGGVHEEAVRVPLILSWPQTLAPARVKADVQSIDLAPTLSRMALGTPMDCDGVDLRPELGADGVAGDPSLSWKQGQIAAAQAGFKLILSHWPGGQATLHELGSDPGELHDVAAAHPRHVARLQAHIDRVCTSSAAAARYCQEGHEINLAMLDADARQQLEAMGYLDPAASPALSRGGP